jgi:pimeloyl-ACP methyl ester carboxylesterase
MKIVKRFWSVISILFCLLIITVVSCKKEDGPVYDYFISKEFKVTYQTDYINGLIDLASDTYPELADIIPLIDHDIDIFKIVYETEVDNKYIQASGLLCIPSDGGEYPVICFQNGTNTVNDYAPSEYFHNPAYQFVEIIASMGFVVLMPDYPGFGESAGITHPYLIKEPTVRSIIDLLFAVKEMDTEELPETTILNEYFLMGYSQGGWATLSVHKAIEQNYHNDFNLEGSVCGAGPYDLNILFDELLLSETYPMPVYLGYIINSYSVYKQFSNPVSDILKEPYASILGTLYTGMLGSDQINNQLTTIVTDLFTEDFLTGLETDEKYSSVRNALDENSISPWNTSVPLFLVHGGGDTSVNPVTTDYMYTSMINAGTSSQIITKEIIPELDHADAILPAMIKGLSFIMNLHFLKN